MPRIVRVVVLLLLAASLAGCRGEFDGLRLTVATGGSQGVYWTLGNALADAWSAQLGIARPDVVSTAGSSDNVNRLLSGKADIAISQADVAAEADANHKPGQPALRALARVHDDYIQVIVPATAPATRLADLRGKRVSIGLDDSGVRVIAKRLLAAAGMSENDIIASKLSIDDSVNALRDGRIDAFIWSGGLPTLGITNLAQQVGLRMIDIGELLPALRTDFPVYGTATVPVSSYGLTTTVTTLVVRNFLLATDRMPDNVAEALTRTIFLAQPQLVERHTAARSIDPRSAIETTPVLLHPGAQRYYHDAKV